MVRVVSGDLTVPDPAALDEVIAGAARVTITNVGVRDGLLLDTTDAGSIAAIRDALAVAELPGVACMCMGDVSIRFSGTDGTALAAVGYHHGRTIRWTGWDSDAVLVDGPRLLHWLADQGLPGPLERHQALDAEHAEARRAAAMWTLAIPGPLATFDTQMLATSQTGRIPGELITALHDRLATAVRDPVQRVRGLLAWNGSGTGLISGYPVHEGIPGTLLAKAPIATIVTALTAPRAHPHCDLGAVRHLAGARRDEAHLLPDDVRSRLITAAETFGPADNLRAVDRLLRRHTSADSSRSPDRRRID